MNSGWCWNQSHNGTTDVQTASVNPPASSTPHEHQTPPQVVALFRPGHMEVEPRAPKARPRVAPGETKWSPGMKKIDKKMDFRAVAREWIVMERSIMDDAYSRLLGTGSRVKPDGLTAIARHADTITVEYQDRERRPLCLRFLTLRRQNIQSKIFSIF